MVVLKFSLPVLLCDEALKFVARNYTDGKEGKSIQGLLANWRELFALIVALIGYGYCWYLSEKPILDKLYGNQSS